MFTKIIVGTDGSEAAMQALRAACALTKLSGAELHVVHVPHPETVAFATGAIAGYHMVTTMPAPVEVEAAAQKILDGAAAVATAENCAIATSTIRRGDPGDEIVAAATACDADLIVTGRRGLGNLAGLVLGSTSQRITHTASCAVLTVPQ